MADGSVNDVKEFMENIFSDSPDIQSSHNNTSDAKLNPIIENDTQSVNNNFITDNNEKLLPDYSAIENENIPIKDESLMKHKKSTTDSRECEKLQKINLNTKNNSKESVLSPDCSITKIMNSQSENIDETRYASISLKNKMILENYTTRKHMLNIVHDDLVEAIQKSSNNKLNDNGNETKSSKTLKDSEKLVTRSITLAEDSRLVKIALPTNPINLVQSNAQFLSKSRNFLNFITEKSTNIMERTLLPQHIANKYGITSKQTELIDSRVNKELPVENEVLCSDSISDSSLLENSIGNNSKNSDDGYRIEETLIKNEILSDNSNTHVKNEIAIFSSISESNCPSNKEPEIENLLDNVKFEDSTNLLQDSVYLTLLRDHTALKIENRRFLDRIRQLEEKNQKLEAEKNGELFMAQLKTLEKTVDRLNHDLKVSTMNQETLSKEFHAANKERESMVMKYAIGEKQLIEMQRARDTAERKLKVLTKDHDLLQAKLRQVQNERTRICNILDSKCNELVENQKQVEKLREDVNVKDVKLKWGQNKLKSEMEAHKETQQKLEKATARINEMKDECENVRRETQKTIRQFQESEENKAVTLDQQLKEQQARLILERHVTEDKEMLRMQLQKEVDSLKHRQEILIEENNSFSLKMQDLEKNRLNYESNLSNLKIIADQRQKEIIDLVAKVSQLETLKLQLKHQEQCLSSTEAEVERLRHTNEELQIDMDACRQREAHMLDFTQKLTDKNVRLQSEFSAIEAKTHRLEVEQGPLRERISELAAKVKCLEDSLLKEQTKRMEECEILAKHAAEQTQLAQNLAQQLEDSQGENSVLKRKHQLSLKEMTRELQQYRKRLEVFETASPSNSLDPISRTVSNASLNTGDALNGVSSDNSTYGDNPIQSVEPDRQTLIDRIIKLQKINVKRAEKLDFLEEHARTLVEELQRKTKIIQNYMLHKNFDAMGSNDRDKHKAELARHGGIMASVYNHKVSDEHMTLELSLEINQKLQTVLEDTLLKNITLKDNIDTLGEEIARLTIQNQERKVMK